MYEDYLKQITEAKTFERGNRITDGAYLWEVLSIKIEKKRAGVMFIAELLCRESMPVTIDPKLAEKNEDVTKVKPIAVGEKVGYVVNLNSGDSAFGNVKAFMLGLDGTDPKAINAAEFEKMLGLSLSPAQPFRGAFVRSTSFRQPIAKPKSADRTVFLGHNWAFVPQTAAEISGRRVQLDAADAKK